MTLNEDIRRIREMMEISDNEPDNTINIKGKILDLENLTDEQKQTLEMKDKVIVDKNELEYPIVMIQLENGKVIVFDVDGSVKENEFDI